MERIQQETIKINSPFESYWGVFLVFGCNLRCDYCIQKIKSQIPQYSMAKGYDWVKALNSIESRTKKRVLRRSKIKKLAIIGGEPTLHPDFFYILNNLDYHYLITVTTNLSSAIFKDLELFAKNLKRRKFLRFNVSYHPSSQVSIDDFIKRIKFLKNKNIEINRIFTVAYPPDATKLKPIQEHKKIFSKHRLSLEVQRFMGLYKGKLYPHQEDNESRYDFQDNIDDFSLYHEACNQVSGKKTLCKILKVIFAPDGAIYNCHYKLYSKSKDNYGNIFKDKIIDLPQDFFFCDSFGYCNPCDFGQTKFKRNLV